MKSISTDVSAGGDGIAFDDLHVTNGAEILHIVFVFFFHNNVFLGNFFLDKPQKVENSIRVDSSIGDNVSEVFVSIFGLKQQLMVLRDVEDLSQDVQGVYAVVEAFIGAGAFDFVADGDFEFDSPEVFENEAGPAGDSDKVEFFHFPE